MATSSSVTLENLLSGVPPAALDRPCSDDHLIELALRLSNWKEVAYFLKLRETEIEEVEAGVSAELVRARGLRMLRKWRAKYGEQATYRCLCGTLWKLGKVTAIEEVIKLLKEPPVASHAPVTSATSDLSRVPVQGVLQAPVLSKVEPVDDLCTTYVNYLKFRYGLNMPSCVIQFPRPPTHVYFDLSLIEREEREKASIDSELACLAVEGRVMEMMEKRSPVQLEDIFKLDAKRRKVILIEGPPGSGKTTLSWHICQKWEAGEPFPEFRLVIYVQLRDPAIQSARSIADLLPRRDDQMAEDVYAEIKASDGEGVLFILDGWDELPGDLPWNSPVRQLIEPSVHTPLQRSTVIITSRPEASTELHNLASSRVQIVGFTPEKVEDFFSESLNGDSEAAKTLMESVKEHPAIESSCSLPLNAAIIVTLFLHMGFQLPSTLTGVFVALVLHCILRHCKSRADIRVRSLSSFDTLPAELQQSFDSLCVLAFRGILVNQILFTEDEVSILPSFETLSLLQVVESFVTVGSMRTYHFLHLSVQELLAAWHISRLPADAQSGIIHDLQGRERFAGVFQYIAGLTSLRATWSKDVIKGMTLKYKHTVTNNIYYKRRSFYSEAEFQVNLLLQCLHEAQDHALYQLVADQLQQCKLFFKIRPSPVACHSLGYLLPLLSPTTVTLDHLDEQCLVLLSKGLQKGWADHQKPRGGLSLNLDLIFSLRTNRGVQAIAQLLSKCGVQYLYFRFCVYPPISSPFVLKRAAEELTNNCSVRSFGVQMCDYFSTDMNTSGTELCETMRSNHTLETLSLYSQGSPFLKIDVASIARGLTDNSNSALQKLVLQGCKVTDDGTKALVTMLSSNVTLKSLNLSLNRITDVGVQFLAEVLTKNNRSLTSLDLSSNLVTDIGAEFLASMLEVNASLERLILSRNSIYSKGVGHLADAMKHNNTLTVLMLDRRSIYEGLEFLASALTVNKTVRITDGMSVLPVKSPPGLAEKLLANGVLQQLLIIAIEKTESEFGKELTFVALVALLEEWNYFYSQSV